MEQTEVLTQIMTSSMPQAAQELQHILHISIDLHVSYVAFLAPNELPQAIRHTDAQHFVAVQLGLRGPLEATLAFLLPCAAAAQIVLQITGKNSQVPGLDALSLGTWSELGLSIIAAVANGLQRRLQQPLQFALSPPRTGSLEALLRTLHVATTSKAFLGQLVCHVGTLQAEGYMLFLGTTHPLLSRSAMLTTAPLTGDNDYA